MKKFITDLMEMSKGGEGEVFIAYNLKGSLSIYPKYQIDYIPKEYHVGVIDLEVYKSYEDIEGEINSMINE